MGYRRKDQGVAKPAKLLYSKYEAAEALGCSTDWLDERLSEFRVVRKGRNVMVPVAEIEAWVARTTRVYRPLPSPWTPKNRFWEKRAS